MILCSRSRAICRISLPTPSSVTGDSWRQRWRRLGFAAVPAAVYFLRPDGLRLSTYLPADAVALKWLVRFVAGAFMGRNHFLGMAFAAILWAFLDAQSNALQIQVGVSNQLVKVIQGVIVLSVVIAYEIVRRFNVKLEQRRVAVALGRVPAKETVSA